LTQADARSDPAQRQRHQSQTQKQRSRRIATPRARVEHVFGAMRHMGGKVVRCMGIARTTFALNRKTASYNLQQLVLARVSERAWRSSVQMRRFRCPNRVIKQ